MMFRSLTAGSQLLTAPASAAPAPAFRKHLQIARSF